MAFIFHSNAKQVTDAVDAAVSRALEICGGKAESYAKMLCPVDTGNLRNSITHQRTGPKEEVIGSNVEYAPYVELGTKKMKSRPFLRPAAENHAAEYKAIIENELAKIK